MGVALILDSKLFIYSLLIYYRYLFIYYELRTEYTNIKT